MKQVQANRKEQKQIAALMVGLSKVLSEVQPELDVFTSFLIKILVLNVVEHMGEENAVAYLSDAINECIKQLRVIGIK